MSSPSSVLFVCNYNTIRSPMAEELTKLAFGEHVFVQSAGLEAGLDDGAADPFVAAVLKERGIVHEHEPKSLDDLDDEWFDLVVTLTPRAHHRALEMTRTQPIEVEYWPVPDPTAAEGSRERQMEAYRETRDYLEERIRERLSPG